MSYRKNYSTSLHYSGSVRYTYPASENGGSGSASYSGSIPVNVAIDVDTHPFDNSVDRFNNSVDTLTGSVVAMNAAQCAAINQTAMEVSKSLTDGFFGTIATELSQQLSALDSAIKAGFGLIQEQGKAVTAKKDVMETDYNRISSRYVNLFADLDSECYKRIYALDKQSFNLSEKVQDQLLSVPVSNTAASNLLNIQEESVSKILLLVSGLNRKVLEVLKTLRDYITQENRINALVNSFLFSEELQGNIPVYIPAIWTESDGTGAPNREVCITEGFNANANADGKKAIMEKVDAFCAGADSALWSSMQEAERNALTKEFNAMAETHFADTADETGQRVYKMMLSLWQNSELYSFERSI